MKLLISLSLVVALGLSACGSSPTESEPVYKMVEGTVQVTVYGYDRTGTKVILEGAVVQIAPHALPEQTGHIGEFVTDLNGETPVFQSGKFALLQNPDGSYEDRGVTITASRQSYLVRINTFSSSNADMRLEVELNFDPSNP